MSGGAKLVIVIVVTILIIGGGGWYFYSTQNVETKYEYVVVERGDLLQEVNVTGRVNPVGMVDIGFPSNGTIESLSVSVGDTIEKGALLATLDDDELQADLSQALASLTSAKAQFSQYEALVTKEKAILADLVKGAGQEEIAVREVKVDNAKITVKLAKSTILNTLESSYTKADDAVRTKLDAIFSSPRSANPSVVFTTTNLALRGSVEMQRASVEAILNNWRMFLDTISLDDNLVTAQSDAKGYITSIRILLDDAALLVAGGLASGSITQTTLDGYASNIFTGRTNINTAFTNVLTDEQALVTAESNLKVEENELALLKAGNSQEKINAQAATVTQAEASLAVQRGVINEAEAKVLKVRTLINNTKLRSPIAGIITNIVPEIGESITTNKEIITIISEGEFEVESDVTETDIVNIHLGQEANITLDAYGEDVSFNATVQKIDPAEQVIEGVPTYTVTFALSEPDERIRSGMTANIDIVSATRNNVIAIPQRTIVTTEGKRYVRLLIGDTVTTVPVSLGIRGSDGRVEILSGVKEGDLVVTFVEEQ